jgi:hypothetical protein
MLPAAIQQEIVAEVRRFIVEMGAFHVPSDAIEVRAGVCACVPVAACVCVCVRVRLFVCHGIERAGLDRL